MSPLGYAWPTRAQLFCPWACVPLLSSVPHQPSQGLGTKLHRAHRTYFWIPTHSQKKKKQMKQPKPIILGDGVGVRGRRIPGAHQPASLALSLSPRFNEKPHLKRYDGRNWRRHLIEDTSGLSCTQCTNSYTQTYKEAWLCGWVTHWVHIFEGLGFWAGPC